MLALTINPLISPPPPAAGISVARVEAELARLPHLRDDRRQKVRQIRRKVADARKLKTAIESIGSVPAADEALHLVISGRFALFHCIPALIELAGQNVAELWIATLGFSRSNVDDIAAMLDDGRIEQLWLLCSHYFKGTSGGIYEHAQETLAARSDKARFLSIRTHAKLVMMRFTNGEVVSIESSANLRSCKNIETATIVGSPEIFRFHRGWISDMFKDAGQRHR